MITHSGCSCYSLLHYLHTVLHKWNGCRYCIHGSMCMVRLRIHDLVLINALDVMSCIICTQSLWHGGIIAIAKSTEVVVTGGTIATSCSASAGASPYDKFYPGANRMFHSSYPHTLSFTHEHLFYFMRMCYFSVGVSWRFEYLL